MVTGIILLAVVAFVGVISYRRPRLEQRVFKKIPLIDWINILILPMAGYLAMVLILKNILSRNLVPILDFDQFYLLSIGVLFFIYSFVGLAIHFVGKVLSRYISPNKHSLIYQVNEVFHGKLSHYMGFIFVSLTIFTLALLEINHPLPILISGISRLILISAGILFGVSSAKSILIPHQWFGGYNKPLFALVFVQTMILFIIFNGNGLRWGYYPVNLFIISMCVSLLVSFAARQILILTRLNSRSRFRIFARIFSA